MSTPVALTPITQPTQARAGLTADQITAFVTLIASANPALLTLPTGKAFSDIVGFNINVQPNGGGQLIVSLK